MSGLSEPLAIAQLLNLFVLHNGRVPGFELTAENFNVQQLLDGGFVIKGLSHLDGGCYLMGPALETAIRGARGGSHLPVLANGTSEHETEKPGTDQPAAIGQNVATLPAQEIFLGSFKPSTVEDILYFFHRGQEHLLIRVRGRGWFISYGPCDAPGGCTPARARDWIVDDPETFERITVIPFCFKTSKNPKSGFLTTTHEKTEQTPP